MNKAIIVILCMIFSGHTYAQVGIGISYGADLYSSYQNPESDDPQLRSDGPVSSILVNLNIGPKVWFGIEEASLSIEGQVSFSPFAWNYNDYKGMGAFSFPIMAQVQLLGLSGFSEEGGFGLTFGGGISYTQTDLYFRDDGFANIEREFYQVAYGQFGAGWGYGGYSIYGYVRYGSGDLGAANWSVGVMIDQNLTHFSKMRKQGLFD